MFVIFSGEGIFGALFPDDAELFYFLLDLL
jgi:hypothetical protein